MRARRLASPALALLGYLASSAAAHADPLFTDVTDASLGSPQPCKDSNEGCYSSYVVMADLDGDHDLDIVFASGGGYYVPDTTAPLVVYLNDGKGHFTEVNATLFGGFQGRVRQVAVGDVDGDGDLDIYVPDGYAQQPDALFINDGKNPPTFTNEGPTRLPISSRAGAVRFGDVDNDGDLDLVITDWGTMPPGSPGTAHVYLNDGKGHFVEKVGAVPQNTQMIGTGPIDIDFFDADGDFDLDLVMASRQGNSLLFLNDGTGTYTNANAQFPKQLGPYVYGPDECDVDGDGDLDVWLDNAGPPGRRTQLLINDGNGHFTDETVARVPHDPGGNGIDDNRVQCVDIDGDGHLDAVVASLTTPERVMINDGTGHFTYAASAWSNPSVVVSSLGLDMGDVNGDKILDAVTAEGESGSFLNRLYFGNKPQLPDTRPPAFRLLEQIPLGTPPGKAVVRFAVTDNATTDTGPRLQKAWIQVAGGALFPATFMGGDLFRAVVTIEPGAAFTYRACAVDWAGNMGCGSDRSFPPTSAPTSTASTTGSATTTTGAGGAAPATTGQGGSGHVAASAPSGCGCTVPGSSPDGAPESLAVLLGTAAAATAFSRSRRRATQS